MTDRATAKTTDWYDRTKCTPAENTAREIIDKIGRRGYLAAGANLTFISLLIEHAIVEAQENG